MRNFLIVPLLLLTLSIVGQKADSLITIYQNEKVDTAKVVAAIAVGWQYMEEGISDSSMLYFNEAIELAKNIEYKDGLLSAYNGKANSHMRNNELKEAKNLFETSLQVENLNDHQKLVLSSNLGMLYAYMGKNTQALNNYETALTLLTDEPKDEYNRSIIYGSIAKINRSLKNPRTALEYDSLAMILKVKTNNQVGIATSYTNLATDYQLLGDLEKALDHYRKSLALSIEIDAKLDQALAEYNIGKLYKDIAIDSLSNFSSIPYEGSNIDFMDSAYYHYYNANEIIKNTDHNLYKDDILMGLVEVITYRGDYEQAIPLYQDIYDRNEGLINTQDRAAFGLYEAYKGSNNYKEALKWHEEHGRLQDSLFVDAKEQKAIEITEKYENDNLKKAAELAELNSQIEEEIINQKLESEKAWNFTYLIAISSLIIVLVIGFLIYRQLKKTKESLLKKNKEVSDSINVASNIQSALLPNVHNFNHIGIESLVLYKPKDIVSGDFYFHHRIGDITFFAAADCTGHGIPGAMLSFLAISILDTVVTEHSTDSIDQILFHLNEKINKKLKSKQNSLIIKVGLDITLCAYHHANSKLEFAGTHNPLYLIRQGTISQYKGDKVNIGSISKIQPNSFTLNQLDIQPGDAIYLMSDGYCDQKGGPKNKKFYYAPFRSMLTKNASLPMKRQQEILDKTITDWTGNSDQIDDILVIGIKF